VETISRGATRGVRPRMKRKETTPGGSVKECVVLERSTGEDRPAKRHVTLRVGCLVGIPVVVVVVVVVLGA
jgi:hypothetical protein